MTFWVKTWHMHCGMSSILTQLELSSFDMKLIILAKFWIWNGTHSNNIIHVHEFSALPLVFFIYHQHCWTKTNYFQKYERWVGTWVCWHMKMRHAYRECCNFWKHALQESASLCCNWNLGSSSANTSSFVRLVHISTHHVLGPIVQSSTYFFLVPLTHCLMLSRQYQKSYSTWWSETPSSSLC